MAVGILDINEEIEVRIRPLHFRHNAGQRDRFVPVIFRAERMMRHRRHSSQQRRSEPHEQA